MSSESTLYIFLTIIKAPMSFQMSQAVAQRGTITMHNVDPLDSSKSDRL